MSTGWTNLPDVPPESLAPQPLLAGFWSFPHAFRYGIWEIPHFYMLLIIRGGVRFRAWDSAETESSGIVKAGHLLTFFPGMEQYESLPGSPTHMYQVAFKPASGILERGIPFLPGVGRLPQVANVEKDLPRLVALCNRLIDAMYTQTPAWQLEASAVILELLRAAFASLDVGRSQVEHPLDPLETVLTRLEQEGAMPSIETLADEMGMSLNHFIRRFRQAIGTTPKQYMLTRRLWKAQELLLLGTPVKETSVTYGFKDPLYFSRMYRKLFGFPPTQTASHYHQGQIQINGSLPINRHLWAPGYGPQFVREIVAIDER